MFLFCYHLHNFKPKILPGETSIHRLCAHLFVYIFLSWLSARNFVVALIHVLSHIYSAFAQDGTYIQKLIQPITDAGQKRTVQDLLADFTTPVRKAGTYFGCIVSFVWVDFESKVENKHQFINVYVCV